MLLPSIVTNIMIQRGQQKKVCDNQKKKKNPYFSCFSVQLEARYSFPHGYSANFGIISRKQNKETSAYENIHAYQITAYGRGLINTNFIVQKVLS